MEKTSKTLILLDGNALIHRSFHALPPLTTKKGELVNVVYGFASTLLSVINTFQPDYVAAAFDLKAPTFRHEAFSEYKATRVKAPDELYAQIPRVKELVSMFQIPIYEKDGYEADDIIGTISRIATEQGGIETIIVTGDADALQLVNNSTRVFTMRRGFTDTVLYDEQSVETRYGFSAAAIPDYKGLRGDTSDNIPGVKGIGEKTATQLLQSYGSLESVYDHLADIKPSVREKLERDKASAILSKQLGTICQSVPVSFDWSGAMTHSFDRDKVAGFLRAMDFYSLLKRLPGEQKRSQPEKTEQQTQRYTAFDEKNTHRFWKQFQECRYFSFSFSEAKSAKNLSIAVSFKVGEVWFGEVSKQVDMITSLFGDSKKIAIGYDIKPSLKIVREQGLSPRCQWQDVMLSAYMTDPGSDVTMERLVVVSLGEEMEHTSKPKQMTMLGDNDWQEDRDALCERVKYIFKLFTFYTSRLDEIASTQKKGNTVVDVLEKIELPLADILARMETKGIHINVGVFQTITKEVESRLRNLERSIVSDAGGEFNVNSTKQLAEVLYEKLRISTKNIKKNKTGFSTSSSELEKIRDEHPIVEKIEEYRELFKLKSTYLDVLPTLADVHGRIHTTFQQAVTATGRLSSTDPNLQNIPIRTDLGQRIRTGFVAPQGKVLVSADYSQIDLRCAAHLSGDKKLTEAFSRGEDIHTITAAEINGVAPTDVTKTMRRAAKTLNFGVLYGMGTFGFMRASGVSRDEAQHFIGRYMERFSGLARYIRETKEVVKRVGYVETLFGRRRYVPEIHSSNFQVVSAAERIAVNMPIQGLTADIMKLAMIAVETKLSRYGDRAQMVLQIHDELLFEVDEGIANVFMQEVKETMEQVFVLSVPLVVDVKSGKTWGNM